MKRRRGKWLHSYIFNDQLEEAAEMASHPECDVNWVEYEKSPAIAVAAEMGNAEVVEILLSRSDILVNNKDTEYGGETALHRAVRFKHIIIVRLLLANKDCDVNATDYANRTPLQYAYSLSLIATMKLLIANGANVKINAPRFSFILRSRPNAEANEIVKNWTRYLPDFTRFAKSNAYYPSEFKAIARCFILSCVRIKVFPKDIIHLLLEYIARAYCFI